MRAAAWQRRAGMAMGLWSYCGFLGDLAWPTEVERVVSNALLAKAPTVKLTVSGAIFMILEMNHPLDGMIKISSAPMHKALQHLSR
jgi:hypothetical protein